MVWWVTVIGDVLEVPIVGLNVLAAGCVPDLLTSVLLQNKVMEIWQSLVQSVNIDILVGLPVPWLLYCLINGGETSCRRREKARLLLQCRILVFMLICMLISVVVVIAGSGWKMTKGLVMYVWALACLLL